ncbi:MAG TPA: 6-phospho-beta-glucosidase [Candidatus Nanopelagicales bacterium]
MRLTVVGGGSTYTPELVDGLARLADRVPFTELVLVDPDRARLAVVGGFADRLLAAHGSAVRLTLTDDLAAGVSEAAAVLLQLRVGGQQARAGDETFPLHCGCVGQETTGAGGLAKALRTVPVVLDIARVVRERALPDAWIVDFTNPVGIVTRALLDDGHRAVGLCNVAIGFQRLFAQWLAVPADAVALDHVGLNHLTWIRAVTVAGADRLPQLLASHGAELAERIELPRPVFDLVGAVPSYYLRYFYAHDAVVDELRRTGTRADEVLRIERELLDLYADPALTAKPDLLAQRGGAYYSEAAVALLASLLGSGSPQRHVVNQRNGGLLPFLPERAVVELPAMVDAAGLHPVPIAPLDPQLAGLVGHVSAYEELALAAALHGGRQRVEAALLAHPLVGQVDLAVRLADLLIAGNTEHLAWAR